MTFSEQTSQRIVIVTQAFDPHTDELLVLLRYMGQGPIRINTECIPGDSLLSYTFAGSEHRLAPENMAQDGTEPADSGRYTLFIDGRLIEAEQIGAIWWRQPAPYRFIGTLQPEELLLATAETEQAMQGFWLALSTQDCYWMSDPMVIALARNRPEQIRRAHRCGFAIPRSLLTTHSGHLRTFYQETGGQVVYRMLSTQDGHQCLAPQESGALVSEEMLAVFEDMVSVPCLFHQRLESSRFLQVVVIGTHVFAAQTSGKLSQVAHWWSPEVSELSYEPAALPDDLVERCRTFVQSYGLEFGVIQLALGPGGQLFFVSLDPVGSFLWLEQQCPDLRMSEALAGQLIVGMTHAQVCHLSE
jgi:hypothetical protein